MDAIANDVLDAGQDLEADHPGFHVLFDINHCHQTCDICNMIMCGVWVVTVMTKRTKYIVLVALILLELRLNIKRQLTLTQIFSLHAHPHI
jgi:hypothetical protein